MANTTTALLIGIIIVLVLILQYILYIQSIQEPFFDNTVMPYLMGGLGNNLFQLASSYSIARQYNKEFKINMEYLANSYHSDNSKFFDSIFKNFKKFITTNKASETIYETSSENTEYPEIGSKSADIHMMGYFQNAAYIAPIREEFIGLLHFNESIANKYPKLNESMFIHLRGGDFKQIELHNVDLKNYYLRAIDFCKNKGVQHYYIFTNDMEYAKSCEFLKDIEHEFVNESEIDSLYLMSKCQLGGIGANSTFSWWGLYLNIHRPYLILPNKWYNSGNIYTNELYFPNVMRLPV